MGAATALGLALLTIAAPAAAQGFPNKAVRIVVPFPPGGGVDVMIRAVASKLSARWGQPVIIDNRAGAGGVIGAQAVAIREDVALTGAMAAAARVQPE